MRRARTWAQIHSYWANKTCELPALVSNKFSCISFDNCRNVLKLFLTWMVISRGGMFKLQRSWRAHFHFFFAWKYSLSIVELLRHYTIRKWERLFLLVKIAWGDRTNILVQIIWGHELVVWHWCFQYVHGVKLILQQDLGVSGSIFVGLQWCSADLHSFCSSMRKHDRLLWRSIRL